MDLERLLQAAHNIGPTLDLFIVAVVHGGLWDLVHESRKKGMSGHFQGVSMRTWCMAGRVMLTLESEGGTVTFLGREDRLTGEFQSMADPRNIYGIGLHSIQCTDAAAVHMLHRIIEAWSTDRMVQRTVYKDDTGITLDVLAGMRP